MEQERLAREKEEKEKAEKAQKLKDTFGDANSQWEKDKAALQNMALDEKKSGGDAKKTAQEGKDKERAAADSKGARDEKKRP